MLRAKSTHQKMGALRAVVFTIFVSLSQVARASTSYKGVDDWTSSDLKSFFKKNGAKDVTVGQIEALGLSPFDLFDGSLTEEMLENDLKIDSAPKRAKVLAAVTKLDATISEGPGDFFEWRIANLRIFHFWCLPMAMHAPRAFLIWLRLYHNDETNALEAFDDVVEQMPPLEFWVTVLCYPGKIYADAIGDFEVSHDTDFFTNYVDTLLKALAYCSIIMVQLNYFKSYKIGGLWGLLIGAPMTIFFFEGSFTVGTLLTYNISWSTVPLQVFGEVFATALVFMKLANLHHRMYEAFDLHGAMILKVPKEDPEGKVLFQLIDTLENMGNTEKESIAQAYHRVFDLTLHVVSDSVIIPGVEGYVIGCLVGAISWSVSEHYGFDLREWLLDVHLWLCLYFVMPLVVFGTVLSAIFFLGGSYTDLRKKMKSA